MPHYNRNAGAYDPNASHGESVFDDDTDAMQEAAQALRAAELESFQPASAAAAVPPFARMSIEELHKLAAKLDVPDRGSITERDELIAAIRTTM